MTILSRHFSLCLGLIIGLEATASFAQSTSGIDTNQGYLPFSVGGTTQMTLTPQGLGIGTTNPLYSLDVNGNVRFSGGSINGKLGIGTSLPIGTLDIEDGHNTASLCLNGQCTSSVGASCGHIANGATCQNYTYSTGATTVCGAGFNMTWETISMYRCDNGTYTDIGEISGYGFCSNHAVATQVIIGCQ